ncbi:MAG: plasmid pRiA4b ORF-3 family protein [Spirochaetia bacterium]|jgi:hypothetical protein|nr:plasmid pRiA4b ORF-3 family protein [Spirochaetia bacterium]
MNEKIDEDLLSAVCKSYRNTASLTETGRQLGLSYVKVRKILITAGVYHSDTCDAVLRLYEEGIPPSQIAFALSMTMKQVNAFIPYERTAYNRNTASKDASKCELYRKRIKQAKEQSIGKKKGGRKVTKLTSTFDNSEFEPVRLHLELSNRMTADEIGILHQYGNVKHGKTISRDILVPSDITLHALHFIIQKLFGWQNSHLREFSLPDKLYDSLTKGTMEGFTRYAGILFQYFADVDRPNQYWDDIFDERTSYQTWLRRKYRGPYTWYCDEERYDTVQKALQELFDKFLSANVRESWSSDKIVKTSLLKKLTIKEAGKSIAFYTDFKGLLERLEVCALLTSPTEKLHDIEACRGRYDRKGDPIVCPCTRKLDYAYDFGDDWHVAITRPDDYSDLLKAGIVTEEAIQEATDTVRTKHLPVCIAYDGYRLVDDVGGIGGFLDLLQQNVFLHGTPYSDDPDEDLRGWARDMGWSTRMGKAKNLL